MAEKCPSCNAPDFYTLFTSFSCPNPFCEVKGDKLERWTSRNKKPQLTWYTSDKNSNNRPYVVYSQMMTDDSGDLYNYGGFFYLLDNDKYVYGNIAFYADFLENYKDLYEQELYAFPDAKILGRAMACVKKTDPFINLPIGEPYEEPFEQKEVQIEIKDPIDDVSFKSTNSDVMPNGS